MSFREFLESGKINEAKLPSIKEVEELIYSVFGKNKVKNLKIHKIFKKGSDIKIVWSEKTKPNFSNVTVTVINDNGGSLELGKIEAQALAYINDKVENNPRLLSTEEKAEELIKRFS